MPREVEIQDRKRRKHIHLVYEPDEVDFEYQASWRLGREGDWVLTDDGFVVQVLAAGRWADNNGRSKVQRYIRTCTGTFSTAPGVELHTRPRDSRHTVTGKAIDHKKITKNVRAFASLVAMGIEPSSAYLTVYNRCQPKDARKRSANLLRIKEVRELVAEDIKALMNEMGIDDKFIIENFAAVATDPDSPGARVSALKELAGFRGLNNKITQTATLKFRGIPQDRLEGAQKALSAEITAAPSIARAIPSIASLEALEAMEASFEISQEQADDDEPEHGDDG